MTKEKVDDLRKWYVVERDRFHRPKMMKDYLSLFFHFKGNPLSSCWVTCESEVELESLYNDLLDLMPDD